MTLLASSLQLPQVEHYPPRGRQLVADHVLTLRSLPLVFTALLLRDIRRFDWQFPVERRELVMQLEVLRNASTRGLHEVMQQFAALPLSPELQASNWASEPERFVEALTADLWAMHAIDRFQAAATQHGTLLTQIRTREDALRARLCIVLVGRGAVAENRALFQKLRIYGTRFTHVDTREAPSQALAAVLEVARESPEPYRHWYVDGALTQSLPVKSALVDISYDRLRPMREKLLRLMHQARVSGTAGPEALRSTMTDLRPEQLGAATDAHDLLLQHFEMQLLSEGSGTQIFSTTFVQWAAREILRRAQPYSLLLRYAPRQMERPMNELLADQRTGEEQTDPEGSLVDAEVGAYYTWLSLMKLDGAANSQFLACFESGREVMAISPGMAQGVTSDQACDFGQILRWNS